MFKYKLIVERNPREFGVHRSVGDSPAADCAHIILALCWRLGQEWALLSPPRGVGPPVGPAHFSRFCSGSLLAALFL